MSQQDVKLDPAQLFLIDNMKKNEKKTFFRIFFQFDSRSIAAVDVQLDQRREKQGRDRDRVRLRLRPKRVDERPLRPWRRLEIQNQPQDEGQRVGQVVVAVDSETKSSSARPFDG